MKKYIWWVVGSVMMAGVLVWLQWPDGNVRVVGCDVGQGDAFLVTHGFSQVLIDGGPGEQVLTCLGERMPFWDRRLEMVVVSHPQRDHMEGVVAVLERYQVETLVTGNTWAEGELFSELSQAIIESGTRVVTVRQGDALEVGTLRFEVLWPQDYLGQELVWDETGDIVRGQVLGASTDVSWGQPEDVNAASVVLQLDYGEFEALFTGDIGLDEELTLLEQGLVREVELVKVPHHGSKYSSSLGLVKASSPEVVMVGVGENSYGHPVPAVLKRWEQVGAKVRRTDEGVSVVVSDGVGWWEE